ncbi:MAG: hypothetical protein AAGJ85_00740 [Pseudomonadota bacterium]
MTVQLGFQYVNRDGTYNEAGIEVIRALERAVEALQEKVKQLEEEAE